MPRGPHPTEPDVFDDRRNLADLIWQDQAATIEAGGKTNPHMSVLAHIGYRKWGLCVSGYTRIDSTLAKARVLRAFYGKPFLPELERHLNGIGWRPAPDRLCEERNAYLESYVEIDEDGTVRWGFQDTVGRDLRFKAFCSRFELVVCNGPDHVARSVSAEWDNETSIEALGLTDDDYRFVVSAGKDMWWFGELRFQQHHRNHFDFAERDGHWIELEDQGWEWDGETPDSVRIHTEAVLSSEARAARQAEREESQTEAERMLAEREAEEARYAERKANANMRIVAMAQRNWKGDRLHPSRNYGANWYRTLWALGYRPRVWHGSLIQPEPTEPFTSADARNEVRHWDGWRPFADELERLERLDGTHVATEDASGDTDDAAVADAGLTPEPQEKPTVRADVLATVRRYYESTQRKPPWYGENWYRVLLTFGESPDWHGDREAPTEPFTSADAREQAQLWSGWTPIANELERIGR